MTTRQEDIQELNERLEVLAKKRFEIFEEYKTKSQALNDKAKEILESAGILDQWADLEKEKGELNVEFQKLLDPYNNAIKQVQGFRNWLNSKENPISEPTSEPNISEETLALEQSIESEKTS